MDAIAAKGLSKSFKGKYVVRELDMHGPVGSIYGLIGENGAGKSTTQKMVCGLLRPTSGEISLFGQPIDDADIRSRMGVLVENPGVYPGWTAQENLLMQAMNLGIEKPREAVGEALDAVGLGDTAKKRVKEFSLGMKQRLGIAAALLGSPLVLILDEPINGLDPEGIRDIRRTLLRLNRERHVTMLISSHILGELSRIATHYGIIRNGTMVEEVSGEDLARECRDYMRIKVAHPEEALSCLAEHMQLSGGEVVDGEIRLPDAMDGAAANRCLFQNGYIASELSFHQMDLEEYFMRKMGGGENA